MTENRWDKIDPENIPAPTKKKLRGTFKKRNFTDTRLIFFL